MALRRGSVRLVLCALLTGTASAWALAPHDKAVGVHSAQLSNDQAGNGQVTQPQSKPAQDKHAETSTIDDPKAAREREEDRHDKIRSDTIAGIIGLITLLVLSVQTYFFRRQANSLEATIVTMRRLGRRQSKDMRDSLKIAAESTKAAKESGDLTRQALILTQRPRIRVGNIGSGNVFERPAFHKHGTLTIQFDFENIGGTPAHIKDADAMIVSNEHGLPYSYPMGTPRNPGMGKKNKQPLIEPKTLAPGEMDTGVFSGRDHHLFQGEQAEALGSGRAGFFLFIIGWIEYTDDLKIIRRTRFGRRYDHSTGRFLPVSDPDYEHEA